MVALDFLFSKLIRKGTLTVIDPKGQRMVFGDGNAPKATLRIHDRMTAWRLMLNPEMESGEAYMDGRMTFDGSSLEEAIDLIFANLGTFNFRFPFSPIINPLGRLWRRIVQFNPTGRSRRNVKHHYDLSDTLYDLFLDKDRQYSCAYFMSPDDTIEQAQAQKKRHIAAKLLLKPGQKILDIGSGWGGLGLYLAEIAKADVTGLTLSDNQHEVSNKRARTSGVSDRVRFKISDYRHETGKYDRIVSVGMADPRDRPLGPARAHEPLDQPLYFPGWLCAIALGSHPRNREGAFVHYRYRDFAGSLCRDAETLARAVQ